MVRSSARSRGCTYCRQRKRKCDETYPQCGLCRTTNRTCSGPITGRFFFNSDTASVRENIAGRSVDKKMKKCGPKKAVTRPVQSVRVLSTERSKEEYLFLSQNKELHSVPAYDIQVVTNLVYYFSQSARVCHGQGSWLLKLPDMVHSAKLHRMRAPLLAPSLLLLATQSQQQSVFKEALRWYDRGLGYIRGILASATSIPGYEILSIMSAAILMSFFETINSTVDSGYEQHILGAVTLLEANGPETFTNPEYHDIFLAVRGHAITVSFMTGNPTCLSEEEWLTIPFIGIKKSPSEEINDVLLAIIKLLAQLRTSTVVGVGHSEQVNMQEKVLLNLCYLKAELDRIWNEINHWEIHNMADAPNTLESHYTYTNASEARIVAMHGYARLIILLLLDQFPSFIPSYPAEIMNENYKESQLTQASASIISAASYLSQFEIGCAYLRMTLPVQLVAQGSPSSVQRNHAIKILRGWFAEKPLKGLAKKALQNITYGDHNLTFQ